MSHTFVVSLVAGVVVILGSRLVLAGLPLQRFAVRATLIDAACVGVGVVGLVFHCASMFYRATVQHVPGTSAAIEAINAMGLASKVWFAAPALLVLVGLRRVHPVALSAVAGSLAAVGVTMYDAGPLVTHLRAIFAAAMVISGVAATFVRPPWTRHPPVPPNARVAASG